MDFSNLTDEQLVLKAKNNEPGANEEIIVRNKHLVNAVVRSIVFNKHEDTEDMIQEGTIGLLRAINTYVATKSSFSTHANTCVRSAVIDAIRKSNRKNDQILNNCILFSTLADGETGKSEIVIDCSINPETECINKELAQELMLSIENTLSKLEYDILAMYLQGYTYLEIGQAFNKNTKSIDNAIQRIKNKVKKLRSTLKR